MKKFQYLINININNKTKVCVRVEGNEFQWEYGKYFSTYQNVIAN